LIAAADAICFRRHFAYFTIIADTLPPSMPERFSLIER
jgi:hypothetical protein